MLAVSVAWKRYVSAMLWIRRRFPDAIRHLVSRVRNSTAFRGACPRLTPADDAHVPPARTAPPSSFAGLLEWTRVGLALNLQSANRGFAASVLRMARLRLGAWGEHTTMKRARLPHPREDAGRSQSSGMSRPKASKVTASGSGPPRRPVSRSSIAAISAPDNSKSKTSMFSLMRPVLVDFGMTEAFGRRRDRARAARRRC